MDINIEKTEHDIISRFIEKQNLFVDCTFRKGNMLYIISSDYCFEFNDILIDMKYNAKKGLILNWINDGLLKTDKIKYIDYIKGKRYEI